MKGKNKTEIDMLVAEKRKLGIANLHRKFTDLKRTLNEPGDFKRFIETQIAGWEQQLRSNEYAIQRNEANAKIAAQLFNKNKQREELKVYRLQQSNDTMKLYIKIGKDALKPKQEKQKAKFIPPDPIAEILKAEPPEEFKEVAEEITAEITARAILIAEKEAALKALEDEDDIEFPCPHCGRIYSTEPTLKRHITMRHKEV